MYKEKDKRKIEIRKRVTLSLKDDDELPHY